MDPNVYRALVTTARTWKQPKCPLTDEWIRKMWYTYTMEYYSVIKKNKVMPSDGPRDYHTNSSKSSKGEYYMISLVSGI